MQTVDIRAQLCGNPRPPPNPRGGEQRPRLSRTATFGPGRKPQGLIFPAGGERSRWIFTTSRGGRGWGGVDGVDAVGVESGRDLEPKPRIQQASTV